MVPFPHALFSPSLAPAHGGGAGMRPELQLVGEVEFGEATSYPDVHTTDHKEGLCSSFAEG